MYISRAWKDDAPEGPLYDQFLCRLVCAVGNEDCYTLISGDKLDYQQTR